MFYFKKDFIEFIELPIKIKIVFYRAQLSLHKDEVS